MNILILIAVGLVVLGVLALCFWDSFGWLFDRWR